jgi:integrase
VPLHEEAAEATRTMAAIRQTHGYRGIIYPDLGVRVRYLFLRNGTLAHDDYLFANPLRRICTELDILNGDGKAAIHPHRFRHTLGTQLAEKGARMQTIMKILWHANPRDVDDLHPHFRSVGAGRLPGCSAARRLHRRPHRRDATRRPTRPGRSGLAED